MNDNLLRGKKILITQNALKYIAGSEVVTLELAKYFKSLNAKVTVFTWVLENPMRQEFEKAGIEVTADDYSEDVISPDYVWVHHQVLPIGLLKNIQKHPQKTPYFIFFHMSAYPNLYIEHPYIYNLEKSLASKSLFVSQEALDFNLKTYGKVFKNPAIFPNPFPPEYNTSTPDHNTLQNILIVSNHPPKEILSASDILRQQSINVSVLGKTGNLHEIITPNLLNKFDMVITIGKTVQYCLAMKIPVYIYDQFGGCGYLNNKNFSKASYANFSGRGFSKKKPEKIASEIVSGFPSAHKYINDNHSSFIKQFSLAESIKSIFSKLKKPTQPASKEYINHIIAVESIARHLSLKEHILQLKQQISSQEQHIKNIEGSTAVKLAKSIHDIPRKIKTPLRPEVILAMCVYNEEMNLPLFLKHLEKYIDGIVVIDDGSTDNTANILKKHPKLLKLVKKDGTDRFNERENREAVLREAKKVAKTPRPFVLCMDPDERLETRLLKNLHKIARKYYGQNVALAIHNRELWDSPYQYRKDGIWNKKTRPSLFQLDDKMTFSYQHRYHVPMTYDEISQNIKVIDYNFYHLKMIHEKDREARKNLYKSLDPKKKSQKIGYDYLNDKTGLELQTIEPPHEYDFSSIPDYYKN